MALHCTQAYSTWIHRCEADPLTTANNFAWAEAAAAAAAAAATAAAISGAKNWGRCTAIDTYVETSAPAPVLFANTARHHEGFQNQPYLGGPPSIARGGTFPVRWLEQDFPQTELDLGMPSASASSKPQLESKALGCDELRSKSQDDNVTSHVVANEQIVRRVWSVWRSSAVATNQSLRRATRHARGVWRSRLFRAWRLIVTLRNSCAKDGTAHLQKKRAQRFVRSHMERLQVVALLHRRQMLLAYQTVHYFLMLWRLALVLHLLEQKVRAREAFTLCSIVLNAFVTWRSHLRSLSMFEKKVRAREASVLGCIVFNAFATWRLLSRSLSVLEKKVRAREASVLFSMVFNAFAKWRLLSRSVSMLLKKVCAREASMLCFRVFNAFATWRLLSRSVSMLDKKVRAREAFVLRSTVFNAFVTWRSQSRSQSMFEKKLHAREACMLCSKVFAAFGTWRSQSRSLSMLQVLRRQLLTRSTISAMQLWTRTSKMVRSLEVKYTSTLVRETFLTFRNHVRHAQEIRRFAKRCEMSSLKVAFRTFRANTRTEASLKAFQMCSELKLLRIAFKWLYRSANILRVARSMVARKISSWFLAALLAFRMQVQVARSVKSFEALQNFKLRRRMFAVLSQHVKLDVFLRELSAQRERKMVITTLKALRIWFENCRKNASVLSQSESLQESRSLHKCLSAWRRRSKKMMTCRAAAASVAHRAACHRKDHALRSWHSSYRKALLAHTSLRARNRRLMRTAFRVVRAWFWKDVNLKKLFQQLQNIYSVRSLAACFSAFRLYTKKSITLRRTQASVARFVSQRKRRSAMCSWLKASAIMKVVEGTVSFQTCQNIELCRKVLADYKRNVQVEVSVRSFGVQRGTMMVWSALQAWTSWQQKCRKNTNLIHYARSSQESRRVRKCLSLWYLHAHKKTMCCEKAASMTQELAHRRKCGVFRSWHIAFGKVLIAQAYFQEYQQRVLRNTFLTLRRWSHKAVDLRKLLQRVHSLHSLRQLAACFMAFNLYTQKSLLLRTIEATAARAKLGRKKRLAIRTWRKASAVTKANQKFAKKQIFATTTIVFHAMVHWRELKKIVRKVSTSHDAFVATVTICRWKSAEVALRRFRKAMPPLRLTARCCLWYWLRLCPMPAIFITWRLQAAQLKHERYALNFAQHRVGKTLQRVVAAWISETACMRGMYWRTEWQRTLRNATVILNAWGRRTRLLAASHTRHANCNLRLLSCSIRWWRFAAIGRRAELDLQVGALRAWGLGVAQCRRIRDEVFVGQWADEVAEAFAMRRLARFTVHGFTAWSSHALALQSLRLRLQNKHDLHLKCVGLVALRKMLALSRFSEVETLFNGVSALYGIRSWHLNAKVCKVASARRLELLTMMWRILSDIVQHRRACKSICRSLTKRMYSCGIGSWRDYTKWLVAAEASANKCRITTLRAASFQTLFDHAKKAARRGALPQVLRAWRQASRESKFSRRHEKLCGFRKWQEYCHKRLAMRRRVVIAELLNTRRQLRSVWLLWQLTCFSRTPSHDLLLERWSDAVTAPTMLRPLVTLHASNIA